MNEADAQQIAEALAAALKPSAAPPLSEIDRISAELAAIVPLGLGATPEQKSQQALARERLMQRKLNIQGHVVRGICPTAGPGAELIKKHGAS